MLEKMKAVFRKTAQMLTGGRMLAFWRNLRKKQLGVPEILSSIHSFARGNFLNKATPCYIKIDSRHRRTEFWQTPAEHSYYYRSLGYRTKHSD